MVWTAFGHTGIIGPSFFVQNVNTESYLKMISEQFHPYNSLELIFMQDGAPPHWAKTVRDWLNSNLQQRWIGRRGVEDKKFPWPARSTDLTLMNFLLLGVHQKQGLCQRI